MLFDVVANYAEVALVELLLFDMARQLDRPRPVIDQMEFEKSRREVCRYASRVRDRAGDLQRIARGRVYRPRGLDADLTSRSSVMWEIPKQLCRQLLVVEFLVCEGWSDIWFLPAAAPT